MPDDLISPTVAAAQNIISGVPDTLTSAATNQISSYTSSDAPATPASNTSPGNSGSPDQRVRLYVRDTADWITSNNIVKDLDNTNGMLFPYTPEITYNSGAQYANLQVTQMNQDFHYYTHTPAVQIQVTGKFTSRTQEEAKYTFTAFQFLRAVTKMRFGYGDNNAGQPPPILLFSGWGSMMFNQVPCILTQYSFGLPSDVDYVHYGKYDVWLPVVNTVSITLIVQHTPDQLVQFNWDKFASGDLVKGGFT